MMKKIKPWSISTAVRNPDRVRGFLRVLTQMDGREWNNESQLGFQARLLQARLYGVFNNQFYNGLTKKQIGLLESGDDIGLDEAHRIIAAKHYEDPSMRGRNSFKPLHRFGFVSNAGKILRITESGRDFLREERDYEKIFLRCFLKWQLPNPIDKRSFLPQDGYCIKPFVGVLHLIREVNLLCQKNGMKVKGLTRHEFEFFALTLIDWRKIKGMAENVISFRRKIEGLPSGEREGVAGILAQKIRPDFDLKNCADYADNAIRYFRVTKFIHLRGRGDHIDLAPTRQVEIDSLLRRDSGNPIDFQRENDYGNYLSNPTQPELPGETQAELLQTLTVLHKSVGKSAELPAAEMRRDESPEKLKATRDALREKMRELIRKEHEARMLLPKEIRCCAENLRDLIKTRGRKDRAVELERLATEGLRALDDAREIRPNYPISDDGQPSYTAPAGKADIECHYAEFALICEVTLLTSRDQWFNEGQPVMRHLRQFENDNDGQCYCIFVAPTLHRDTVNTFWNSARYEYEGSRQRIAPMTVKQFCQILDFCAERRERNTPLTRNHIRDILARISGAVDNVKSSEQWIDRVPEIIEEWKQSA